MNRVLIPLGGMVLLVVIDDVVHTTTPKPRTFIAFAFLAVVLAFMAEGAPELAIPLAWLAFIATLMTRGTRVFKVFSQPKKGVAR